MNVSTSKSSPSRSPRFSVQIPPQDVSYQQVLDTALEAEKLGYDSVWLFDHFFPIFGSPKGPCLEGWTALSAIAAMTKKVRLGILVSGTTYRHPSVLAKMATTVDIISEGRLEFGLGGSWFEFEHDALGIAFPPVRERLERLEEALQLIRLFWTKGQEGQVSYKGTYYQLNEAHCNPGNFQKPHPPIMVGGGGEKRTLRTVARHANLWNTFGTPDMFRHKIKILHEHCKTEGREFTEIEKSVLAMIHVGDDPREADQLVEKTARRISEGAVTAPSQETANDLRQSLISGNADAVTEKIRQYHEVGVSHVIFGMAPHWDFVSFRRFANEVIPKFRSD